MMNEIICHLVISLFLILCTFYDIRSKQIPVRLILIFGLVMGGLWIMNGYFYDWTFLIRLLPGIFLLMISFISKQSIGYGDGAVILLIGILLAIDISITLVMIALLFSALTSLFILILKKGNRQTRLPFMPFLLAAWGVILIWF